MIMYFELNRRELHALATHVKDVCGAEGAAYNINYRLEQRRSRYLQYGPYWFALKAVLAKYGYVQGGDHTDEKLVKEYSEVSDLLTMCAADLYKEFYIATYFDGTREWEDKQGNMHTLIDPDME